MKSKKAQVWVETVIYTLIAFALIGVALSIAKPKLESLQDKAILGQTMVLLNGIDNIIFDVVQKGEGNVRIIEINLNKGILKLDAINETLLFELEDSPEPYSEPGTSIKEGEIEILTEQTGELSRIEMKLNYSGKYNLTVNGKEETKLINPSTRSYKIAIKNNGETVPNKLNIDLGVQ